MQNTAFLPFLRHQLGRPAARRLPLGRPSLPLLQELLAPFLPAYLLSPMDEGPHSRQRFLTLRRTFFGFLWQVLNPNSPCREALRQIQAEARMQGEAPSDSDETSAYCQARQRLPFETLERIYRHTAKSAEQRASERQRWLGRPVVIIDGTTLSMPDTAQNQALYPQESQQKPGCGFPVLRLVGVLSLASGAVLEHVTHSLRSHDLQLFDRLRPHFKPGDVVVADRGFSAYAQISLLFQTKVDVLFRLHQGRPVISGHQSSFKVLKKLGYRDWLVLWTKPPAQPRYMSEEDWAQVPPTLTVRILESKMENKGFRTQKVLLVTTLLDAQVYTAEQIACLYLQRWRIELSFRDLKTTLHMDVLRCKTPEMIQKEILMHLIAHNLIRLLMQQAALAGSVSLERISFKGALDTFRQYVSALGAKRSRRCIQSVLDRILNAIARGQVPFRPERREPRAVKRRPKQHQLLTKPRHEFREYRHRGKYPKRFGP